MSWTKIKRPPVLRPQKVRCPHCHSFVAPDNFCGVCGKKLRHLCKCDFIVGRVWNCGESRCPGMHIHSELLREAMAGDFSRYKEAMPELYAKAIDKWDGKLPQYMGNSGQLPFILKQ